MQLSLASQAEAAEAGGSYPSTPGLTLGKEQPMPKAIDEHTTSTRRFALRFGATAALAGIVTPAIAAPEPSPNPDAELIAVCRRFVDVRRAQDALVMSCNTLEDEDRAELEALALDAEYQRLMVEIEALPAPTTPAGAAAVARVASTLANRRADGEVICVDDYDWLTWTVIASLSQQEIAP